MVGTMSLRRRIGGFLIVIVGIAAGLVARPAAAATALPCERMSQAVLAHARISIAAPLAGKLPAELIPPRAASARPGSPISQALPPFCRVVAHLAPVAGSEIVIELWMPVAWNGKLLGLGNHGFAGEFERNDMAMGLLRGYAVVATDTGHGAANRDLGGFNVGSAEFATGNGPAVDDFAWRAIHEMTIAAKALVRTHYGLSASRAYFDGCSLGGRQAINEAQQFPSDYDGIISGSAAMYTTGFMASDLWLYQLGALGDGARITPPKLELATQATVAACDRLDGLADGLIADPRRCRFDVRTLVCKAGADPAHCLTAPEALAIERAKQPLRDRSGRLLYEGLAPGSERLWTSSLGQMGQLSIIIANFYRYMVLDNPAWSADDALRADVPALLRQSEQAGGIGAKLNSVNPDLSAFRARGGKLIQYHGWADPAMAPGYMQRYYDEAVDLQPGRDRIAKTRDFYRLFMVPGMGHCAGGYGPTNFGGLDQGPATPDPDHDLLAALDRWVEQKTPPARIIATEYAPDGTVKRQMPLCPSPEVAMYVAGDANVPSSYRCRKPRA